MTRSENCANMHIKQILWNSYCLIFYFGTSKVNQTRERYSDPWHVYSNPNNPTICPVLSLAKYLFYNPYTLTTNSPLFPGNCHYEIFLKISHKVIKEIFDRFQPPGVEKGMLGAHYIRRGYITIVATGCTVYPTMDSIFMRDCWSIGPIKYRCIHYQKAGDQFLGRSMTGIFSLSKDFGMLPLHWYWTESTSTFFKWRHQFKRIW